MLAIALTGWCASAALAVGVLRRRAADVARAEHLARVAHELRGPLQAAGLVLHTARRTATGACAAALGALEVELGRIALATGDLTAVGVAAAGAQTCDVAGLLRELTPGWQAQAQAHGRPLSVRGTRAPAIARGDRLRLAQALGNLVANALEHGAGPVEVALRSGPAGVAVEVRDGGRGLPATVRALASRPPDASRARGRGLSIAVQVAEAAGGRLSAAPSAGGARLILRLPVPARALAAHGHDGGAS